MKNVKNIVLALIAMEQWGSAKYIKRFVREKCNAAVLLGEGGISGEVVLDCIDNLYRHVHNHFDYSGD